MIDPETRRFVEQSLKDYDSKNKAERAKLEAEIKKLQAQVDALP